MDPNSPQPQPSANQFIYNLKRTVTDRERRQVLLACCIAIMATVVRPAPLSPASDYVQSALITYGAQAAQVVNFEYLLLAIFILVFGALGDIYGHKRLLLIGLTVAFITNFGTVLTANEQYVTTLQTISMIATSAIIPLAFATIVTTFVGARRPIAFGIYFFSYGIAMAIGATNYYVVGTLLGMQYTYVIAVIFCATAFFMVARWVTERKSSIPIRWIDVIGNILWGSVFILFVYSLVPFGAGLGGQSATAIIAVVLVFMAILVRFTQRLKVPRLRFSPFALRELSMMLIVGIMIFFAQSGMIYHINNMLQVIKGYSSVGSAILLAPFLFANIIAALIAGKLATRISFMILLCVGLLVITAGVFTFAFIPSDLPYGILALSMILLGGGLSLANIPRSVIAMGSVPEDLPGTASGFNNAAGRVGNSLGVVAMTVIMATFSGTAFAEQGILDTSQAATYIASIKPTMTVVGIILLLTTATTWIVLRHTESDKQKSLAM